MLKLILLITYIFFIYYYILLYCCIMDRIKSSIKNPYYFTLFLLTLILILIFYCYDMLDQNFCSHIKFFIYSYISLSLLFIFYYNIIEDDILIKHNLKKNTEILNEINNEIQNEI